MDIVETPSASYSQVTLYLSWRCSANWKPHTTYRFSSKVIYVNAWQWNRSRKWDAKLNLLSWLSALRNIDRHSQSDGENGEEDHNEDTFETLCKMTIITEKSKCWHLCWRCNILRKNKQKTAHTVGDHILCLGLALKFSIENSHLVRQIRPLSVNMLYMEIWVMLC